MRWGWMAIGGALVACGPSPPPAGRPPRAPPKPSPVGALVGAITDGASNALDVLRRDPKVAVAPPPADAATRPYSLCDQVLAAHGLDLAAENAEALALVDTIDHEKHPYDVIIVPGFVPLDQREPIALHPTAKERLDHALADFRKGLAPFVLTSGGYVHPDDTPYNEALEMKRYLLAQRIPEARIFIEPCARHSHTNLRNAGRLMLETGLSRGLITTSWDQATFFGDPQKTSFDARTLADLGYLVGDLKRLDAPHVTFVPSGRCFERGPDPLDP